MNKILSTILLALCVLGAQAQTLRATAHKTGDLWQVAVTMDGATTDYCALQMDIDGGSALAVTTVTSGTPLAAHRLSTSIEDGIAHILAFAPDGSAFALDGTPLFTATLTPVSGTPTSVTLRDIILADYDGEETELADIVVTLGEPTLLIGDVNGDGVVNRADLAALVSHIIGDTPATFDAEAADINGDNTIDIRDVTSLIEIIINL